MNASLKPIVSQNMFVVSQSMMSLTGATNDTSRSFGNSFGCSKVRLTRIAATTKTSDAMASGRRHLAETAYCRVRGSDASLAPSVRRSRTIARMTIARPAWKAAPTLTLWRADMTARPSPGAPMSAVMTTIERAIMIVWLTPRPMVRRACGSWTLVRTCQRVEPSETAASTDSDDTPRMPRAVIRTAGGMA